MKNHAHYFKRLKGFTLVELMITVAVIGILAAIALPNYTQYVQRSHRSNARNALIQAAQWMERAATASGAYPVYVSPQVPPASILAVEGMRYTLAISNSGLATYTFTATPTTAQAADPCGSLVLTHTNARTVASQPSGATITADECWQR